MNVTFLSLIFVGLLTASSCAAEKPNIVVIFVDDLGYADLSLHGSPDVRTPNIDSIAKNGVRCLQGYVTAPMCAPSRAGIITGRYQQRFGFEFNMGPQLTMTVGLDTDQKTIADLLKPVGYKSMVVGKWDLGASAPYRPLRRGFDEFYGFHGGSRPHMPQEQEKYPPNVMFEGENPVKETGWSSDIYGEKAADFIRRHKSGPFFLYAPFTAPHWPMEAKPEDLAKHENVEDLHRRTFLGMMEGLDRGVGMILDAIRDAGVEKNTLLFFASDNGGATGPERAAPNEPFHQGVNTSRNEPFRGKKGDLYDGGIHVPFFVQWTGTLPAGTTCNVPVISLDIAATAVALADAPMPEKLLDGINLIPVLKGGSKGPDRALFWRLANRFAVRKGDWKLVRDRPENGIELFNLAEDPGETKDLAAQNGEKFRELRQLSNEWNATLEPARWQTGGGPEKIKRGKRKSDNQ
jgi:arylsulfatase A-like enzyme